MSNFKTVSKKIEKAEQKLPEIPFSFYHIFCAHPSARRPSYGGLGSGGGLYQFGYDGDYVTVEEAIQGCEDMIKYLKGESNDENK